MSDNDKSRNLQHDTISVCICTYQRPEMLNIALEKILSQETSGKFSFEVVVVDNDSRRSAEHVVKEIQKNTKTMIVYECEPEQNISMARNRALANSTGNLIAFIDDDEYPIASWLRVLLNSYKKYSADGVLGPVLPSFEGTPPAWLINSGLCDRNSFATGTILRNSKYMRTGNVLFGRHILKKGEKPFDNRFGRTGGEDVDFFRRMVQENRLFVWCNEAPVYETVPLERQKLKFYVKRALLRGVIRADQEIFLGWGTVKSVAAVPLYTASLPFLLVVSRHHFIRYFIKICYHLAKLLAQCGVKLVRERKF